jgi:hypothetical protein
MMAVGLPAAPACRPGRFEGGWEMLVVTSNWAIADGTLYGGPDRGHVADFLAGVHHRVLRAGFRRDGTYRPVDGIDVVLAGDTCDWLVSGRWTDSHRPWHGGRTAAGIADSVAVGSLRRGGRLLAGLSRLARSGLCVPEADPRGRPALGSRHRVAVRVTLLSGDRDRWIEQHSQASVTAGRSLAFGSAWSNGIAMVRHGDDLDPLCGSSCRNAEEEITYGRESAGRRPPAGQRPPSLGESIAVDLLARFGGALAAHGTVRPLVPVLIRRLATGRAIDMADHLAATLSAAAIGSGLRRLVLAAWRQAVGSWHRDARRMIPDGETEFDCIDPLAAWLEGVNEADGGRPAGGFAAGLIEPAVLSFASDSGQAGTPPMLVLGHPSAGVSRTGTAGRSVCLGPAPITGVAAAPLKRGQGVDVAWIDAGRIRRGGRTCEAAPATVAVFDERAASEADVVDAGADGDHDGRLGIRGRQGIRDGLGIRLESLSFGNVASGAEWIDIGSDNAGDAPGDDVCHPRIINAA